MRQQRKQRTKHQHFPVLYPLWLSPVPFPFILRQTLAAFSAATGSTIRATVGIIDPLLVSLNERHALGGRAIADELDKSVIPTRSCLLVLDRLLVQGHFTLVGLEFGVIAERPQKQGQAAAFFELTELEGLLR